MRHRDAQARAEERLLDVVRGQRIAGEEHVDEAVPDEMAQVVAAARVHDGRAGDDQDFSACRGGRRAWRRPRRGR